MAKRLYIATAVVLALALGYVVGFKAGFKTGKSEEQKLNETAEEPNPSADNNSPAPENENELDWYLTLDEAEEAAKKENRYLGIFFASDT